jgi:uridine kinase
LPALRDEASLAGPGRRQPDDVLVSVLPGLTRADVIAQLADASTALPRPTRVAVDGVDAAGKTTLAAALADELGRRGEEVTRLCADEYLRPPEERYRRGRESPEGYYLDSFDHEAIRQAVRRSLGLTLVDGIFLLRPELNDLWDLRIMVHVALEESIRRGSRRDADLHGSVEDAERLYRRRYAPGQRLYLERARPHELADVVIDNSDPDRPKIASH